MNEIKVVMKKEFAEYKRTNQYKAHVLIIIMALLSVLFLSSVLYQVLSICICLYLMKQMTAYCFAREKDFGTLETLLASPVRKISLFAGKGLFPVLVVSLYYAVLSGGSVIKSFLSDGTIIEARCVLNLLLVIISFIAAALAGSYRSAGSPDMKRAASKAAGVIYPFMLFVSVAAVLSYSAEHILFYTVFFILAAIDGAVIFLSLAKIKKMDYQTMLLGDKKLLKKNTVLKYRFKSKIGIIFWHEWNYFRAIDRLHKHIVFLTLAPALYYLLADYYFGYFSLYSAILIMLFSVSRIPMSIVSYAIGGEKVYKTFETLLSAPVTVRQLVIGKSIVSIVISVVMIIGGAVTTLITGNIYYYLQHGIVLPVLFDAGQLCMLLTVFISCCLMILLTGYLSLLSKTPRKGLYSAAGVGYLFVVLPAIICFTNINKMIWITIYNLLLIAVIGVFIASLVKTSRIQIFHNTVS